MSEKDLEEKIERLDCIDKTKLIGKKILYGIEERIVVGSGCAGITLLYGSIAYFTFDPKNYSMIHNFLENNIGLGEDITGLLGLYAAGFGILSAIGAFGGVIMTARAILMGKNAFEFKVEEPNPYV